MNNWTIINNGEAVTVTKNPDEAFSFFLRKVLSNLWSFRPISREWAFDIMTKSALDIATSTIAAVANIDFHSHTVTILRMA